MPNNSLQKKVSSESSTSKAISASEIKITTSTLLPYKPSIQNQIPRISGTSKQLKTTKNFIYVDNRQYQLVKSSCSQLETLVSGHKILMKSPPIVVNKESHNN